MKNSEAEILTYEGLIMPSHWDDAGEVTRLHLALQGEINLPLVMTAKALDLIELVGSQVQVTGKMIGTELMIVDISVIRRFPSSNNAPGIARSRRTH